MVLDMPSLFGVFKESSTTGEGLGSSIVQQTVVQAYANGCAIVSSVVNYTNDTGNWLDYEGITYTIPEDGLYFVIQSTALAKDSSSSASYVRLLHGVTVLCSGGFLSSGNICQCSLINAKAGDIVHVETKDGSGTITCNPTTLPDRHYRNMVVIRLGGSNA
jgi:hypothetical protein